MTLEIRRAADGFVTRVDDRETRHAFSFGSHYDPANTGFGPLVCHNDDRLVPGGGYPDHPHSDLEIVTWVLDGVLVHTDAAGQREVRAGEVQVMSAGSGVRHAELADPATPTRFVQAWVLPDEPGTAPWHAVRPAQASEPDALTPVLAGTGAGVSPTAGSFGTSGCAFWVTRLHGGSAVTLPEAPRVHAYVARGEVTPERPGDTTLSTGDSLRAVDEPGLGVTAHAPAELLVWSFRY